MRRAACGTALLALSLASIALGGCGQDTPDSQPEPEKSVAVKDATAPAAGTDAPSGAEQGTPMADRVATIGIINKRNNLSQDVELKPGESKRVGSVTVKLDACEKTPPWEEPPETGAFVQVQVQERISNDDDDMEWHQIFSGWLFKNSPSLNVVEHPVYDVWVKDCAMSFPGE